MREPIRVAVTGAAGQIGYALLPRIANGDVFGPDQPVILQLLEITPALGALEGVRMELVDCAPPLLKDIVCTDDPNVAFADAGAAFLVGAKPRSKGMERKDLLRENGPIFTAQGKAMNDNAKRDVKVLVMGNPANTNALIALSHAKDLSPAQFHAMTRLDHNRAMAQLAGKAKAAIADVDGVTIWGNHSATQYPDYSQATIGGKPVSQVIDDVAWLRGEFITTVQQRGAAIIAARGLSSAASAAHAAICHMRDWHGGQKGTRWVSMAVPTDGSYDVPEGIVFSFPCRCEGNGTYSIVKGLAVDDFGRAKMTATIEELLQERAAVQELL